MLGQIWRWKCPTHDWQAASSWRISLVWVSATEVSRKLDHVEGKEIVRSGPEGEKLNRDRFEAMEERVR